MRVYKKIKHPEKKNICVDFDNVVHQMKYYKYGEFFEPVFGAREALIKLKGKYRIVIFTSRASDPHEKMKITEWLNKNYIPFNEITNIKVPATRYIDDRAIQFHTWDDTLKQLGYE